MKIIVDVISAVLKTLGRGKVGIYCRVSSFSSAQLHSLAGQASCQESSKRHIYIKNLKSYDLL